jgi:hypothetical protein
VHAAGGIVGLAAAPGAGTAQVSRPVAGHHWPIPATLVAQLPHGPVALDLEPNGAEVPFSGSGSVLEWLRYAAQVHHQDKAAERTKKRLTIWIVVLSILGFVGLWLYFSGVVLLTVALFLVFRRRKVDKLNVEDRRLEVFSGALQALAPELKPKKPVVVALDFTAYTKHETVSAGDVKEFRQCWLELKLPLLDGSQVAATVTLQVKQKSRRKRKYTKVKSRIVEHVVVRVMAPRAKTFRPVSVQGQNMAMNGLTLKRGSVGQRHAVLIWSTALTNTVRGRYGLQRHGPDRLDSRQLLTAIVASYKLTARGERSAA